MLALDTLLFVCACVCLCVCMRAYVYCHVGGVAHLGNLIIVSTVVASQWVWLNSVGVVCVSVSITKALLCVCVCACLLVLTGGVAHLGNLISVSIVVASQWVWLNSVGVVCMSVSITKALDALLCVCVCACLC